MLPRARLLQLFPGDGGAGFQAGVGAGAGEIGGPAAGGYGVALGLGGAIAAQGLGQHQQADDDGRIGPSAPARDHGGGLADVGAVEVEADALDQRAVGRRPAGGGARPGSWERNWALRARARQAIGKGD